MVVAAAIDLERITGEAEPSLGRSSADDEKAGDSVEVHQLPIGIFSIVGGGQ